MCTHGTFLAKERQNERNDRSRHARMGVQQLQLLQEAIRYALISVRYTPPIYRQMPNLTRPYLFSLKHILRTCAGSSPRVDLPAVVQSQVWIVFPAAPIPSLSGARVSRQTMPGSLPESSGMTLFFRLFRLAHLYMRRGKRGSATVKSRQLTSPIRLAFLAICVNCGRS